MFVALGHEISSMCIGRNVRLSSVLKICQMPRYLNYLLQHDDPVWLARQLRIKTLTREAVLKMKGAPLLKSRNHFQRRAAPIQQPPEVDQDKGGCLGIRWWVPLAFLDWNESTDVQLWFRRFGREGSDCSSRLWGSCRRLVSLKNKPVCAGGSLHLLFVFCLFFGCFQITATVCKALTF